MSFKAKAISNDHPIAGFVSDSQDGYNGRPVDDRDLFGADGGNARPEGGFGGGQDPNGRPGGGFGSQTGGNDTPGGGFGSELGGNGTPSNTDKEAKRQAVPPSLCYRFL
jgi:hypothetical protein